MESVQKHDVSRDIRIYHDSVDISVAMLHRDDYGVINVRVDFDGVLIEKGNVNLRFLSHSLR